MWKISWWGVLVKGLVADVRMLVMKDELSVAMALVGITSLDQAHPGLVNTNDVDYLVPRTEGHPYARKRGKPLKAKM